MGCCKAVLHFPFGMECMGIYSVLKLWSPVFRGAIGKSDPGLWKWQRVKVTMLCRVACIVSVTNFLGGWRL